MKKIILISLLTGSVSLTGFAATDAATLWADQCAKCHGAGGAGDTKMGKKLHIKDYSDAAVQASFTDEAAFTAIKDGVKDAKGTTKMKAIEGLTDEDVTAMVQYVRSLKK